MDTHATMVLLTPSEPEWAKQWLYSQVGPTEGTAYHHLLRCVEYARLDLIVEGPEWAMYTHVTMALIKSSGPEWAMSKRQVGQNGLCARMGYGVRSRPEWPMDTHVTMPLQPSGPEWAMCPNGLWSTQSAPNGLCSKQWGVWPDCAMGYAVLCSLPNWCCVHMTGMAYLITFVGV